VRGNTLEPDCQSDQGSHVHSTAPNLYLFDTKAMGFDENPNNTKDPAKLKRERIYGKLGLYKLRRETTMNDWYRQVCFETSGNSSGNKMYEGRNKGKDSVSEKRGDKDQSIK
jgi:hypothetical protein